MGLVCWWPLNGNTENNGLINTPIANYNAFVSSNGKVTSQCYSFNGTSKNQYLSFSNSQLFDTYLTGSYTATYWVKMHNSATSSNSQISIDYWVVVAGTSPAIRIKKAGTSTYVYAYSNINIADNTWHHVCITYEAPVNKYSIYIDGTFKNSVIPSFTVLPNSKMIALGHNLNGSSTASYWFTGSLNDVRIYDEVLSEFEIKELAKGLCLHYTFEDPAEEGTVNDDPAALTYPDFGHAAVREWGYFHGKWCWHFICRGSSSTWIGVYSNIANKAKTWTRSCQLYIPSGQSQIGWYGLPFAFEDMIAISNKKCYDLTKMDTWQYCYCTGAANKDSKFLLYMVAGTNISFSIEFYITDIQFEQKDHATPFVIGERNPEIVDDSGYQNIGSTTKNLQIKPNSYVGNYAAYFDGETIISGPKLTAEAKTLSVWVKGAMPATDQYKIIFVDANCNLGLGFKGKDLIISAGGEGARTNVYSTKDYQNNEWNHIVVVKGTACYINGKSAETLDKTNYWTYDGDSFIIGGRTSNDYFSGWLADLRVYSTILSEQAIKVLYENSAIINTDHQIFTENIKEIDNDENIPLKFNHKTFCAKSLIEGKPEDFDTLYKQIDYIQSTGVQYIDTGFTANQDTKIEVKYNSQITREGDAFVFGSRESFNAPGIAVCPNFEGQYFAQYNHVYATTGPTYTTNIDNTIIFDKNKYYMNGILYYTFDYANFTTPGSMILFACRSTNQGGIICKGELKMYYCRIWDNGVLIRDFIPVIRKADQKPGLYDLVEHKFYTNKGAGEFDITGINVNDELPFGYERRAYIESNGTQYIDTEFKPNSDTKVDMFIKGCSAMAYYFGAWNVSYNNGAFAVGNDGDTGVYTGYDGQGGSEGDIISDAQHVITQNKNITLIDGVARRTLNYTSFNVNYNLYLFAQNRAGTAFIPADQTKIQCSGCKIYDNDVLVRDLIPCYRIKDNEVGLYDMVNAKFYTRAAGDAFTCSNEFPTPHTKNPLEKVKIYNNKVLVNKIGEY